MVRKYLGLHAAGRATLAPVRSSKVVPLSLCGTTSRSANAWAGDVPSLLWPPGGSLPAGSFACPFRLHDWISTSAPETPTPSASIDLPKTTAMSDAFGFRRPLDPELLFDALHGEAVDYVVIGAFAINTHGAIDFVAAIDLTIAQTIGTAQPSPQHCSASTQSTASARDRVPVELPGQGAYSTASSSSTPRRRHRPAASRPRLRLPRPTPSSAPIPSASLWLTVLKRGSPASITSGRLSTRSIPTRTHRIAPRSARVARIMSS